MLSRYQATPAGSALIALIFLLLIAWLLLTMWQKRRAGIPVDVGNVVRVCVFFLIIAALAAYDALVR